MKNIKKPTILFDVDSTLVTIEGIDYLANLKGVGSQVAALTRRAMNGQLLFGQVLAARLALIRPHRRDLVKLADAYLAHLVAGAAETIKSLQTHGHQVYLISGGFRLGVLPLAKHLKIPEDRVFANTLNFDDKGNYLGFDQTNPLAQNHGKAKLIRDLKPKLYRPILIGDGATDLEVKPHVHRFIGFGGVVVRAVVKQQADCYIYDLDIKTLKPLVFGL